MKVAILHSSINPCGGAERVCLHAVEAFKEEGFKVILATLDATNWSRVKALTGCSIRPDEEYSLFPSRLPVFGIYQRLAAGLWLTKLKERVDLTVNTHGDCLPLSCDVVYMHFPMFVDLAYIEGSPINVKYSVSVFWKLYFQPYKAIQKRIAKKYLQKAGKILTNSSFSAKALKTAAGCEARIVYPPVDVEKFFKANQSADRENIVITTSRITPEKGLDLLPKIALETSEAKFILIGTMSGMASRSILEEILRVKPENLEVKVNLPMADMIEIYGKAKVYLHLMKGEHFGISVVEGMAAGLIPVAHKSGGCYHDILAQGKYGFIWENQEDISEAVGKALKADNLRRLVEERAKGFSVERFKRNFLREVLG
jgi:glycosyltransferase involved in cell wall biosynthesis